MTKQQLFDRVTRHLLTQGRRSVLKARSGSRVCAYRGDRGTRCAIGCLIPEKKYRPDLEGSSAVADDVRRAAGLRKSQLDLALRLQNVHDCAEPPSWRARLKDLAVEFRLTFNAPRE